MHKFHFYFFSFFIFSLLLSSCGGGSGGTPQPSDLSSSPAENSFVFYLETKLHLIGKFQVMSSDGQKNIYETSLPVQWAPRDPDRPDLGKEPQVFPKEGFTLSNLAKGEYLFRVVVSHQGAEGETVIGFIETRQSVVGGKNSPLDFSKSNWVYPDDDGDGFSNIAELTDGFYNEEPTSPSRFSWSSWEFIQDPNKKSDPKDPKKHPTGSYLITPEKIHPTSPDDSKNSKLIGEILSVQAGTDFTVIHFSADGTTVKEKIHFFSKIDGSFEAVLKNSEEEDKLILIATSQMQGDQLPDPKSILQLGDDSLPEAETTLVGKWMKITYRPLKMIRCRAVKGVDPIAGSGYVLLEGEGISADPIYSKVRFATALKDQWAYADEISVAWQGSITRELKVKIPLTAVSGYPQVQTVYPKNSWGECPTNQPVIIFSKSGGALPDLYIPRVDAPHIALLGQIISIDFPIANQGGKEIGSGTPLPYLAYISPKPAGSANDDDIINGDRPIFPNMQNSSRQRERVDALEKIYSGLNKEYFLYPETPQNRYFISPLSHLKGVADFFTGLTLFKAKADPLTPKSLMEQNDSNNSRAVSHSTFIHHIDLDLEYEFPSRKEIVLNDALAPIYFVLDQSAGYFKPTDDNKYYSLKTGVPFSISFSGRLKNDGTFPLIRISNSQPVQYSSGNSNDPLDTVIEEGEYRKAFRLFSKKDYAEGELDLKKNLAIELIKQANFLNQKLELPVLIRVYYSKDNTLEREIDTLVKCENDKNRGCEICKNRLSAGDSIQIEKLILEPPKGKSGDRYFLFIVAETIQIDFKKVKKDEGAKYCEASDKERQEMHLGGSERGTPMLDSKPWNNIIMIPVELTN